MPDALLDITALPNLHPALVHFPIALAAVALLFDAVLLIRPRWASADAAGAVLWALAAAGAGAAYLAGKQAAAEAGLLESAAEVALARHADAALAVLVALGLLAALRIGLAWHDRGADRVGRRALRTAAFMGALAAQGLVAYTADLGGALVYRHRLAVSLPEPEAPVAARRSSGLPQARAPGGPEDPDDGSLIWSSQSGSGGVSLAVSGRSQLSFPGSWGDALLEVRIDPSAFDGSVGLGVHIDGGTDSGLFRIASDGEAALIARSGGRETVLDEARLPRPAGESTLALSVSGRHWKGFVDGNNVVHGHASLAASGRAVLLLDGDGTVRVISLRIEPLVDGSAFPIVAGAAGASEFDRAMEPILAEYLKIQTALAANETEGIAGAVYAIEDLAENLDPATAHGKHAEHYRNIPEDLLAACGRLHDAKDIDAIREGLKGLSKPVSMWVTMAEPEGTRVMHCPMEKAGWVQHGSRAANPYFGSEMPGCGEKVGGAD